MKKDDFAIFDVGSGETALNVAVEKLPSVVLLDIMLPDMTGIEVCQKLKSVDQLKFVPVIIHTANLCLKVRLNAFIAGAHKYIAKPCKPDDIYDCLQGVLHLYDNQDISIDTAVPRMSIS